MYMWRIQVCLQVKMCNGCTGLVVYSLCFLFTSCLQLTYIINKFSVCSLWVNHKDARVFSTCDFTDECPYTWLCRWVFCTNDCIVACSVHMTVQTSVLYMWLYSPVFCTRGCTDKCLYLWQIVKFVASFTYHHWVDFHVITFCTSFHLLFYLFMSVKRFM